MNSFKLRLIFCLLLVSNAVALSAQSIPAANHNVGCSTDNAAALPNVSDIQTVLPAGSRTSSVGSATQAPWYGVSSISTDKDVSNHDIYKFVTSLAGASGGFNFEKSLDIYKSNYVHVALYAETGDQTVKVRLASAGGEEGTYTQYQIDSPEQTLKQGWNYLNLPLSIFHYADGVTANKFDAENCSQIGFVFSTGGKNIYVDDIYFYTLPIPSANHNLGCSSDDDSGVTGFNPEGTIIVSPAGNRKVSVKNVALDSWYAMNIFDAVDANNETIYKINTSQNGASGGFTFEPEDLSTVNKYVHAAVYVPEGQGVTTVQIRLSTDGASSQKGNWNDFQVNSRERTLKSGWNYLNLKLDVASEDRTKTNTQSEFAYTGTTSETASLLFDLTRTHQVGFVFNTNSQPGTVYVSDVYFYSMPYASTNSFSPVINWGTTNGAAECQVSKIAYTYPDPEAENPIDNGADENNSTYLGLGRPQAVKTTADNPFYVVAELKNPITVSDVEMVWGNGYPINYEVYALTEADKPETWSEDNIKIKLTNGNRLFTAMNPVVAREPFYNSFSDLQNIGNQNGATKYIVVKMWQPMGSTFGFKLDEIHVGAYDDNYDMVDHIGIGDFDFRTEEYNRQTITPTARNSRNAVLLNRTVTSVNYSVEGAGNDRNVTVGRDVNSDFVWSSRPGTYKLDVSGTIDGKTVGSSVSTLTVRRDWIGANSNTKSIIQTLPDDNFHATNTETDEYNILHIKDGDESTRWSSGVNAETARNKYITIKLSNNDNQQFKVRDIEFLWERAYPATYAVYGLSSAPVLTRAETTDGTTKYIDLTYDEFNTANSGRLLYEASLRKGVNQFPYNDLHTLGTADGDVKELNDTKYLVIAFKEPIVQDNNAQYGVSMFELYAQAVDMTSLNSVTTIQADNEVLFRDNRGSITIKGYKSEDQTVDNLAIDHITGATFSDAASTTDGNLATNVSGPVDGVYTVTTPIGSENVEVAQIWDGGNNTYIIQTGKDRRIAGKTYNITANYVLTSDSHQTAQDVFTLQVLKKPMSLAAGSTEENLKFDDGYYVEEMLEEHASQKVLTVDLTDVDFTTDYNNVDLSKTVIPGPRRLNRNADGSTKDDETVTIGKDTDGTDLTMTIAKDDRENMNPNAIYFVTASGVTGENVAVKNASTGEWYIDDLRLFDGYNYNPSVPSGDAKITAHNAFFYTNLAAHKKSIISVPFDVRANELSGINFYTPDKLKMSSDKSEITLTPEKSDQPLKGNNIYIAESEADRVRAGGYAIVWVSTSYKQDGKTVEVSKTGGRTPLSVEGSNEQAELQGTYIGHKIPESENYSYYLYSSGSETFRSADDEWFDYSKYPEHVNKEFQGQDFRRMVLPFYAYLRFNNTTSTQPSYARAATITWLVDDGTVTGINGVKADGDGTLNINAPMYDILGRRVDKIYHGVVIQNGHKFYRK